MGYLVQALLDGRWHPVGDPLDDLRQAASVRAMLASGGIWSQTRIAVLNEWGLISEFIDDSLSDGSSGAADGERKGA